MKVLLSGYEGSKSILKISSYLTNKYLNDFEVIYLNYGTPPDFVGTYVSLNNEQGGVQNWSKDLVEYLELLKDDLVIFALDDYLINSKVDKFLYNVLLNKVKEDVVCAKLCDNSHYTPVQYDLDGLVFTLKPVEYTCTTQYTIWQRKFLIEVLKQVSTPWEFELKGTEYLNKSGNKVIGSIKPVISYYTNSCLSNRWKGIDYTGLNEKDLRTIKKLCI